MQHLTHMLFISIAKLYFFIPLFCSKRKIYLDIIFLLIYQSYYRYQILPKQAQNFQYTLNLETIAEPRAPLPPQTSTLPEVMSPPARNSCFLRTSEVLKDNHSSPRITRCQSVARGNCCSLAPTPATKLWPASLHTPQPPLIGLPSTLHYQAFTPKPH